MLNHALKAAILVLGLCATHASAQVTTVPVRAGEHEDFTRVVFQIPEENTWILRKDGTSAEVIIGGPPLVFDLSQTFSRIPRTRLARVVAEESRLTLALACDCDIRASNDLPEFLVIDISGAASREIPVQQSTLRPLQRPARPEIGGAKPSDAARRAGSLLARSMTEQGGSSELRDLLTLDRSFTNALPQEVERADERPAVADSSFASDLAQILARSVSGGKLNASVEMEPHAEEKPEEPRTAIPSNISLNEHFSSRATGFSNGEIFDQGVDEICSFFDLIRVSDQDLVSSSAEVKNLMASIYDDLDRVRESEIMSAIVGYFAIGHGAEARALLNLVELPSELVEIVMSVSALIDLDTERSSFDFSNYLHCGPEVSLWHVLSSEAPHFESPDIARELARLFEYLNPTLRAHLGPEVVRRLSGDTGRRFAEVIQANIERVASPEEPRIALSRASLEHEDRANLNARNTGNMVSPETSDEALLFLLQRADAADIVLDDDLISVAESRLLPLRGHMHGKQLKLLLARAYANRGNFDEAFEIGGKMKASHSAEIYSDTKGYIFQKLSEFADDIEFIHHLFEQRPWMEEYFSSDIAKALSDRLLALGFSEQAGLLERFWKVEENSGSNDGHTPAVSEAVSEFLEEAERTRAGRIEEHQSPRESEAEMPSFVSELFTAPSADEGLLAQSRRLVESSSALRTGVQDLLQPSLP